MQAITRDSICVGCAIAATHGTLPTTGDCIKGCDTHGDPLCPHHPWNRGVVNDLDNWQKSPETGGQ